MGRSRALKKTADVVALTGPSAKAVFEDEKLRRILKDLAGAVTDLYSTTREAAREEGLREVTEDHRVREQLDTILGLLREGAQRAADDVRPKRSKRRWLLIVAGGGVVLIWLALRSRS